MSAVVVNYKARRHLVECVRSLRAEGIDDVVVADNDSGDGSEEALAASDPGARFLPTGGNLGYGAAANRAAAVATGDLLLVCNSDVVLEPGAVKAMTAVLDVDRRVAIVGPRVENVDGSLYPSPRTFPDLGVALGHAFLGLVAPRNRFTRSYRMLDWDHAGTADADWVSGACFLVRGDAWVALGGFDEAYFMYAEDVDLCWRAARAGWKVAFEPAARVVHAQGVSSDLHPYRMIVEHHRSLLRFFRRTTTGPQAALLPLVAGGLVVRAGMACAQRALASPAAR
ncbi:MAG TPA: glycosyltransferase family 2 protein [Acidimicrobiales bacterium]|nr:glycosyltransferase family 2 protein [Acidimicrobiales bacterium]